MGDTGPCVWQQEGGVVALAVFWIRLAQEVCSEDTSEVSPDGERHRDMSHLRSSGRAQK